MLRIYRVQSLMDKCLIRSSQSLQMVGRCSRDSSSSRAIRLFSTLPSHLVVPMPALSPTMESGSISKWNLNVGDKFDVGTVICEVETDKASVSYEATDAGYLAKILVQAGEIKVGQPIMITVEEPHDVAAFSHYQSNSGVSAVVVPTPAVSLASTAVPVPQPGPSSAAQEKPSGQQKQQKSPSSTDRHFASPLARKLAKDSGTSIEQIAAGLASLGVAGSGPHGRIVAADVLRAASIPPPSKEVVKAEVVSSTVKPVPTSPTLPPVVPAGVYADFILTDSAVALANRQTAAKQSVPHYYLSIELNLTNLMKLRADLNNKLSAGKGKGKGKESVELSVLDFLVKASALAMKQVPDVNGAWMETFVRRYEQVDINLVLGAGSVVATPVLRDVAQRGLSSISVEIGQLEDTLFSDDGALVLSEDKLALGTFSIHNLGLYGIKSAAPIVMTPQACALSLGSIVECVVPASDNEWAVAPLMTATLSCDHRVVDGAVGAQWLSAFKTLVENPTTMLL